MQLGRWSFSRAFPEGWCKGWACRSLLPKRWWQCVHAVGIGPITAIGRSVSQRPLSPAGAGRFISTSSRCTCRQSRDSLQGPRLFSPMATPCKRGRWPKPWKAFQSEAAICFERDWRWEAPSWDWPYVAAPQAARWCSCWDCTPISRLRLHRPFLLWASRDRLFAFWGRAWRARFCTSYC